MKEVQIELDEFLKLRKSIPILDARSEGEYGQSHIPEAINLPILNNEERKIIGTVYKQQGNQQAVLKGFELVGPRFHSIIKDALVFTPEKKVLIYCWRGGMRSEILSWLLGMAGFEVFRLKGGYKVYRTLTYITIRKKRNFLTLGGKTGAGKTLLLKKLKESGEHIIDLESLAGHKGSSFGGIGMNPQPSVEQFENMLAEEFFKIPENAIIWIENESRRIGKVILANELYASIVKAPLVEIQKTIQQRIFQIKFEYASLPKIELISAVSRLQKKLGGLRTSESIEAIQNNQPELWISILLQYYDKSYEFDLKNHQRDEIVELDLSDENQESSLKKLLAIKNKIQWKTKKSD
ncbi:tRNA 2-selenouridine(34) synthase MnmH [Aquiflexum sp.]|uniref:tRNA 2-selenouridine(34) synthase MnmH n=1 Tax=Aquiflexum sp. TaxID=1872584 RepID=UPI003593AAEE